MSTHTSSPYRMIASAAALCAGIVLHAQLVFVPDTNMRNWFNEITFGVVVVDASGYLNTADPYWLNNYWEDRHLTIDWPNCDMTGLESVPMKELHIDFNGNVPTTIAWPDSLEKLVVMNYQGPLLPPPPLGLEALACISVGSSLPIDYPDSLLTLYVKSSPLTILPPLPSTLHGLVLMDMPDLSALTNLPDSVAVIYFQDLPSLTALPAFPDLKCISLIDIPQLQTLPALPQLYDLLLQDLPLLSTPLPPLVMPAPTYSIEAPFASLEDEGYWISGFNVNNCPLIPVTNGPWIHHHVSIVNMPWTAAPVIDTAYSVKIENTPLVGTLNLPDQVGWLRLMNVPVSSFGMSGENWYDVRIDNVGVSAIAPLPPGNELTRFYVANCPNLVSLPALTYPWADIYSLTNLPMLQSVPPMVIGFDDIQDTGLAYPRFEFFDLPLIDSLFLYFDPLLPGGANADGSSVLDVNGLPNLVWIQSLPDDEAAVVFANCPELACIPQLPEGLVYLNTANTGITCYPNYPSWVGQEGIPEWWPPLCNILNSTCAILNPLIAGEVFDDLNANGVHDGGEPLKNNVTIECIPGGYYGHTGNTGTYELAADIGTFTVTAIPPLYHVATTLPQSSTLTGIADLDTLDGFGIHTVPNITDLVVDISSSAPPVPGFNRTFTLTVSNVGTTAADADVEFGLDPAWSWIGSTPTALQFSNDTAHWSFTALAPGTSWTAQVTANLPPTTLMGLPLTYSLFAMPTVQDTTPVDNWQALNEVVVGSFDPNDKQVSPPFLTPEQVALGVELQYTIRFQNTGTYQASRVVITDTLSTDLRWNTMRLIASSHPVEWYITAGVLHFVFDPIDLPDSTSDEPGSHGFVKFGMETQPGLPLSTTIGNIANIVFDFNAPVITEPAVFTVEIPQGIAERATPALELFPNPSIGKMTVMLDGEGHANTAYWILDASGRKVLAGRLTGSRTTLDLTSLAPGHYEVRVIGEQKVLTARFVKQ